MEEPNVPHSTEQSPPSALVNFFFQENEIFSHTELISLPFMKNDLVISLEKKFAEEGKEISNIMLFRVHDHRESEDERSDSEDDEVEAIMKEEILDHQEIDSEGVFECYISIGGSSTPRKRSIEEVNNSSEKINTPEIICEICRGSVEDPVHYCQEDNHPTFCRCCIQAYLENKISCSFLGSCPTLYCPALFHQKFKKIMDYRKWSKDIKPAIGRYYLQLAKSILTFQCASCHNPGSLDIGFSHYFNETSLQLLKDSSPSEGERENERFYQFEEYLGGLYTGKYSVEEFYFFVQQLFPSMVTMSDEEAWDIFSKILKMIPDPERRGNLHLRYLRDRPRIKTLCCSREHCFRCKTKGFHHGNSCVITTEALDNSVVTCPSCGLALARGDGCDTITCVCGKQFSWTAEKAISQNSLQFMELFPHQTSHRCAEVLCEGERGLRTQAKAYQARNRIEVSRELTNWFKKKYCNCPTQCCVVLPLTEQTDGVREAIELWKHSHPNAVMKCKENNEYALASVFLGMYPEENDRPIAAFRLINQSKREQMPIVDPKLIQSASKWVEKNRTTYAKGLEEYEERSAHQFLFLHGNKHISSLIPHCLEALSIFQWNPELSNQHLTFSNNNASVERVGKVSSRPAVFANLPNLRSTVKVMIESTSQIPSLFTFGLTPNGMSKTDGEGFGMRAGSCGIFQDSSPNMHACSLASSGKGVGQFRKLIPGDILALVVDLPEGTCRFTINETEFTHTFTINPTDDINSYLFGATIAVDHKITILEETPKLKSSEKSVNCSVLNPDHTLMYSHFKKQLRKLMKDNEDLLLSNSKKDECLTSLITGGQDWLAACGGNSTAALDQFETLRPHINRLLGLVHHDKEQEAEFTELQSNITFTLLLDAISWFHRNRAAVQAELKTEMGLNFMAIHDIDAPFIAASNLAEYHTHRVDKDQALASLAYMEMFPDEMHAWYEYNSSMKDPLIPNIAVGCHCLPRHIRVCPVIKR